MTRLQRTVSCVVIAIAAMATSGCDSGGIGMGVPTTGARWGSGAAGPDVFVAGGPVYR
jgi:hypothetical protein